MDGGATATIISAIIGASVAVGTSAASLAQGAVANGAGKLRAAVEVFNGTQYPMKPVLYMHRHGGFLGGIEGQFGEVPSFIAPRQIDVFSVEQNATTDNVGFVLYQSEIFDLLVGWHLFDQGKIWRFMTAIIGPRGGFYEKLPKKASDWGAFFSGASEFANNTIWSGNKSNPNTTEAVSHGWGLRVEGDYKRGIISLDENDNVLTNDQGEPKIEQRLMAGLGKEIAFSSTVYSGGDINKVYISDSNYFHDGVNSNYCRSTYSGRSIEAIKVFGPKRIKDIDISPVIGEFKG